KRVRGWKSQQAVVVFKIGALGMAVAITGVLIVQKFGGSEYGFDAWNQYAQRYANIEQAIKKEDPTQSGIVLVINPPGYHLASGRPAIAIPSGDESALNAAADDFEARFLIVEYDHPPALDPYFGNKDDRNGWVYLGTIDETNIYMRIATEDM
ncbi:MAG: hypothetical protein OEV06_10050, partial [Anaerolineae bacterium]|nr:hypothetical protein [Anaerolineae bacterium]